MTTNIYPNKEVLSNLKKQIILTSIVGLLALSFISSANGQIFEDQFIVCNFESVCTVIDIDDYITKDKSDHLWSQFNNDIDTFKMGDLEN